MTYTIKNEYMTVSVAEKGAKLQPIRGADDTEYLWQGDKAYWSDWALNVFPYVARLTEGSYFLDGELHQMAIHGIAPYRDFRVVGNNGIRMGFELHSNPETYIQYPPEILSSESSMRFVRTPLKSSMRLETWMIDVCISALVVIQALMYR